MKQNLLFKKLSFSILFVTLSVMLQAQPFVVENFDYPLGSVLTANGYTAHSAAGTTPATVTAPTINYAGYLSSGIGNELTVGSAGEDVHRTFGPATASVVYASFLVNVSNAFATTGDYFFHFAQSTIGTTYRSRVFVIKDANNKIAFGISQSSATPNYSGFIYDLNTTYLIVVKHTVIAGATNDVSAIIINPTLNAAEPTTGWIANIDASSTDLTEVGSFAFRQGSSTLAPTLKLDGLRISSTWTDIVGSSGGTPTIAVNPATLSGFTYVTGAGPSAEQNFSLSGANLTANISIAAPSAYEISTGTGASFVAANPLVVNHVGGTVSARPIYVRLKAGLAVGTYNAQTITATSTGATSRTVECSGSVVAGINEPANHATAFTALANSGVQITVNWTDAVPAAAGYLIKGSATSFAAIANPVNGVAEADGALVKNIAAGVGTFAFTALNNATTYYFKIYPYNGSGTLIKYKVDGTIPQSSATTLGTPTMTEVLIPQYIQGNTPLNVDRVPIAYRAQLNGLAPNTTYRFINQVVNAADAATVSGAGNVIYVNADGTFVRTSSPSLATAGGYGEFVTNAQGSYTGWFVNEPTGNARFTPGTDVFFRIRLNDGGTGTVATTFFTTTSAIRVINFGTAADATLGTALRAVSPATAAKNFYVLYDNTAGTGRPLYATTVEATGVDYPGSTSWAEFYRTIVHGVNGSWAGIIPNVNANGVRRMEERSRTLGTVVGSFTSTTGLWGTVDTRNPVGGLTSILFVNLITIGVDEPVAASARIWINRNELNIELKDNKKVSLEIYNILGQPVMKSTVIGSNTHTLPHTLTTGAYILKLNGESGTVTRKFVVQ